MKKIMLKIANRYKLQAFLQVFFIMLNIYFLTYPPKIIGTIIDLLYDIEANKDLIVQNIFYLIGITIVLLIVRLPWRWLAGYVPRSVERDLKNSLFEQFTKIKMTSLQNIKNGELMSYFVKDISEIRKFVYRLFSYGSRIVFTLIIATFTMVSGVNLSLTIFTLLPIIVTAFLIVKIKEYVEKSFRKSQKYFTGLSEYVQESTDAIRTTKAYSGEMHQLKEFIRKNKLLRNANNSVDVHSTLLSTCINICFGLCYGISLLYGSKLVLQGTITTGDFVAFNGYIGLFVGPVSWLPGLISVYKRAQLSYKRLDEVFKLEREKLSSKKEEKSSRIIRKYRDKKLIIQLPRAYR